MITAKLISDVGFTPATADDAKRGLLGYVRLKFAELLALDGITLRITGTGRHALSFPCREDRQNRKHPLFRPLDDRARDVIENAVFAALGVERQAGQGQGFGIAREAADG